MASIRRRLPLTALRTFEAAARLESFKDAAQELGVSATTVSNQIRMLERDWRCLLFVRKTRQVVLTETGQALGQVIAQSFDAIAREIDYHITHHAPFSIDGCWCHFRRAMADTTPDKVPSGPAARCAFVAPWPAHHEPHRHACSNCRRLGHG